MKTGPEKISREDELQVEDLAASQKLATELFGGSDPYSTIGCYERVFSLEEEADQGEAIDLLKRKAAVLVKVFGSASPEAAFRLFDLDEEGGCVLQDVKDAVEDAVEELKEKIENAASGEED